MKKLFYILFITILMSFGLVCSTQKSKKDISVESIPVFIVDPFWPKPLPDNWLLGQVSGIAVDNKDHIWIVHRPNSLGLDEGGPAWQSMKLPFTPAPPVIEFDTEGNVIQAWGGPGEGYDWPKGEHGIFVDHNNNVWIGAAYGKINYDQHILKFTSDGTFLFQIGESEKTGGSNDTVLLGRPTDFAVDQIENEVYISDGYLNHRVIVFDANTGKYKRHWGAYGNKPNDIKQAPYNPNNPPPSQFGEVHALVISNDGLVYVCDRNNNRVQVFKKNGDFLFEKFVAKNTLGLGSVWDIDFSHDPRQSLIYVADGTNQCVWILNRENLETIGKFGRIGRYAGQFMWVHNLVVDSKGNIFTAEVYTGKRAQKFIYSETK